MLWKDVLNNEVSFLDDHHYGGSVKHLFDFSTSLNPELKQNPYWIVGAYGLDETKQFSVCMPMQDSLKQVFLLSTFVGKVKFTENVDLTDTKDTLSANITFSKLSNRGARVISTVWSFDSETNLIEVKFDDMVPNSIALNNRDEVEATDHRKSFWSQSSTKFITERHRLQILAEKFVDANTTRLTNNGHVIYTQGAYYDNCT